jgi:hypothetical protein
VREEGRVVGRRRHGRCLGLGKPGRERAARERGCPPAAGVTEPSRGRPSAPSSAGPRRRARSVVIAVGAVRPSAPARVAARRGRALRAAAATVRRPAAPARLSDPGNAFDQRRARSPPRRTSPRSCGRPGPCDGGERRRKFPPVPRLRRPRARTGAAHRSPALPPEVGSARTGPGAVRSGHPATSMCAALWCVEALRWTRFRCRRRASPRRRGGRTGVTLPSHDCAAPSWWRTLSFGGRVVGPSNQREAHQPSRWHRRWPRPAPPR